MIWLIHAMTVLALMGFCWFVWKRPGWGLVTMPLVVAGLAAIGFASDAGLIVGGIASEPLFFYAAASALVPITIVLVRLAPAGSSLETPWYKTFASVVITVFSYIVLLAALTLIFNALGPLLFIMIVVGVVRYKLTYRYSLALDILSAIGMSMRQSLPLPMALHAAAQGRNDRQGRVFMDIAALLTQGRPLSEAIRLGYRKCPPELLASIEAAEAMNQLPKAIETLQTDISEKVNDYNRVRPVHPWYPILVLIVTFFILLGLMIFIVPKLSEVLSDMSEGQAALPRSTQTLLDFSKFMIGNSGLNAMLITIAALGAVLYFASDYFRRRNPQRLWLLDRIEDWIKWNLPILHWFECTYSQLQLTELVRVGLAAGYPINTTLRNSLGLDVNCCFRGQIRQWLDRIEQGEPVAEAGRRCGLDTKMLWAFDDSVNKGNTVAILESVETMYRSRYNHRVNLLNAIGCPLMVLGLGLGVGWVVYAMFMGAFSTLFVTIQYTMP